MDIFSCIIADLSAVLSDHHAHDPTSIQRFCAALLAADRIFTMGAGRSGLVAKAFAMRIMHLGLSCHVAGEVVTPRIDRTDIAVLLSASGETPSLLAAAHRARQSGAALMLLTHSPQSAAVSICDHIFLLPIQPAAPAGASASAAPEAHPARNRLPLGSLFELSAFIFLESVIAYLQAQLAVKEADMRRRHSILE